MASTTSNFLQLPTNLPSKNPGLTQTSTPMAPVMKPNTPGNIAYGSATNVPTGSYTNNPFGIGGTGGLSNQPVNTQTNSSSISGTTGTAGLASTSLGSSTGSQNLGGNTGGNSLAGLPGGTNSLGTHILTQSELDAQNAQSGQTQQNKPQGLFPSVVSSLANRGTTPNQTATDYTKGLVDTTQNGPFVTQAQDLLKQQQGLASEYGPALATVTNTPGLLANQNARASNLTSAYGAEMQGLAQTLQGANTAQSNQQSGMNSAAGNEYTGSGQQITALNNAGVLAQPSVVSPGQAVFNPATGSYTSASSGGGNPSSAPSGIDQASWDNYVSMAANGQYSAIPSSITSNTNLSGQLNEAAKLKNPSYNPVSSSAQSSITTQQTGNVANMTAAYKSATNLGSQLKDLIGTYGVNPQDLNAANLAIQKVAQNTSSPQYQALSNLMTDIIATYSSILTPGSTTDTARATAASLLNDTASGKSIITTLNNLDDQAKAKIAGQTTSYGETPGSGTGSSTVGGTMFGSFFGK